MALNRKYAALPDLDSAPDIYETPDLTDDNSTLPTGTVRSQSTASSYKDFDEEDDDSPGISRSRLHPDEARSHFFPAQVDARDVDFSDRVTGKRKSYKASSRRQRKREDETEELGDFSDDDDGESLERKIARLRREIEEVKEEVRERNKIKANSARQQGSLDNGAGIEDERDAAALSKILDTISISQGFGGQTSGSRLAKSLATGLQAPKASLHTTGPQKTVEAATYTVTYSPGYQQNHALAKAADFDSRLMQLEKALGISSNAIPAINSKGVPMAILPTLDTLQRQVAVLAESTPSSLDGISRRVRTLTQETERLDAARRSAKIAQDELRATGGEIMKVEEGNELEDSEQTAKINALYGTLSTIENLAPIIPSLLDRLRSLRAIHADAATASQKIEVVVKTQEDMGDDIKKWRQALEKLEVAMKQSETVMGSNMKVMEGWVKELEELVAKLSV